MDPNANLEEQLQLAQRLLQHTDDEDLSQGELEDMSLDATRLAELVQALDEWLKNGGFRPARWQR